MGFDIGVLVQALIDALTGVFQDLIGTFFAGLFG